MNRALHIFYWKNGKGLDLSAQIIIQLAEKAGFVVSSSKTRRPGHYGNLWGDHVATRWHNWKLYRRLGQYADRAIARHHRPPYDVAICLEDIVPTARRIAKKTILVPNQEWFKKSNLRKIALVDAVFCKSQLAERLFSATGTRAFYTGFTTLAADSTCSQAMDFSRYLHVAGRSFTKGTQALLEAWARHPYWPKLTILGTGGQTLLNIPENVHLIDRYLSEDERQHLQATHGIHICPSESEGYGHTISQGMALGAVVVTTDAPPMNELVGRNRGFLIAASRRRPMGLDYCHIVAVKDLEVTMDKLFNTSLEERAELGCEAKRHFTQSDMFFRSAFIESLNEVAGYFP